jgi:hypothetical protein
MGRVHEQEGKVVVRKPLEPGSRPVIWFDSAPPAVRVVIKGASSVLEFSAGVESDWPEQIAGELRRSGVDLPDDLLEEMRSRIRHHRRFQFASTANDAVRVSAELEAEQVWGAF